MAKKILVVDDHVPTRSLIKTILEAEKNESYDVIEAGTGTDCLKAVDKSGPFDLVLLDVNLPDMDGYEVCRALRHVDKKVPIVFVTAKGDLKDYTAGPGGGRRQLPGEADRPCRPPLHRRPLHEHRAVGPSGQGVIGKAGTPLGHIALVHEDVERAEAVARILRGGRASREVVPPGRRVVQRSWTAAPTSSWPPSPSATRRGRR